MKFEEIIKNFPNSLWIRPLFTIIPFNSWIIVKISKFELCFDTRPCVFNDHSVSSCQEFNEKDIVVKFFYERLGEYTDLV